MSLMGQGQLYQPRPRGGRSALESCRIAAMQKPAKPGHYPTFRWSCGHAELAKKCARPQIIFPPFRIRNKNATLMSAQADWHSGVFAFLEQPPGSREGP